MKNRKTEHAGRPIAFPETAKFSDLFTLNDNFIMDLDKEAHNVLSGHCSIHEGGKYRSTKVKPKQHIIDWIKDHMIPVDYDSISFEVIQHDNGCALVLAHYSQILGSHYLAYIDAETIPKA